MDIQNKKKAAFFVILAILLITIITLTTIYILPVVVKIFSSKEALKVYLVQYGNASLLVFILLQILQVVIAAIPGEVIQIGGGYVFGCMYGPLWGVIWGTVFSLIGILLGAMIVFTLTRFIGYPLVEIFVPKDKLQKFNFLINNRRSEIILFLLFLIPGIPKDILTYLAGLTPIRPSKFFIIFTIARFPGILGASIIGAYLQNENYTVVVIVGVLSILLFGVGIVTKDTLINKIERNQSRRNK